MVVERSVALRDALQFVVEVNHYLAQGQHEAQFHAVAADVLLVDQFAALVEAEGHDGADEVGGGDDGCAYVGLLDMVYQRLVGQPRGIVHLLHFALLGIAHIRHVGHGGDDVHIELAVQPLLHDLHVQQAEEATAETEAQGHGGLGLEGQRGVVQLEFLQRGTQVLVVRRIDGIDAGKDHGFHLLESLDGRVAGAGHVGDGVAHLDLLRVLDAADDIAHVARTQFLTGYHVHLQHAHLVGIILHARVEELHLVALADDAVDDLEVGDDASERVEHGVEDQGLQGSLLVAHGMGYAVHDGIQYLLHALAGLAAGPDDVLRVTADEVYYLVLHLVGHGAGHVDLVDHGYDLQVVVDGHIEVGDGLRLHALRGVDHEQGAFASSNRTAHLIREIDMSRRVDEVQDILLSVALILHLYGVALDGDTALALQIHVVEHLSLSHLYGFGVFKQPVGKCRLAVVYMCDDAEIPDILH